MYRTRPLLHCCGLLLLCTAMVLLLEGCSPRDRGVPTATPAARADAALAFTVNGAWSSPRLATSTMESKEAAAGNRFVVLDVSVVNRGAEPQPLLEGKLIALSESGVQTFDTPVTLFNDDYLAMQVLPPSKRVRGKLAYEVPDNLPGVLYWSPGCGDRRILLSVKPAPAPHVALADAGVDDAIRPTPAPRSRVPRPRTGPVAPPAHVGSVTRTTPDASATVAPPSPMDRFVARWTPSMSRASGPAERDTAFFAEGTRSATAHRAPACNSPGRAPRVVCGNSELSALDIRLDQSMQRASHYVDPVTLHGVQEQWNGHVRNACETVDCLQKAYLDQQARIDALIAVGR